MIRRRQAIIRDGKKSFASDRYAQLLDKKKERKRSKESLARAFFFCGFYPSNAPVRQTFGEQSRVLI